MAILPDSSRPIILASSSPRRRELLALGGLDFQVRPAAADETAAPGESPPAYVQRLSRAKAQQVAAAMSLPATMSLPAAINPPGAASLPGAVVIGADTTVVLDDDILGKPADAREAADMLGRLRGREHRVLTAISLVNTASRVTLDEVVAARVPMRDYSDDEIAAYVATGNPLDKAGAYAIQFHGFKPVDAARFTDCFATVMGLPVCRVLAGLQQMGLRPRLNHPLADCRQPEAGACPIYPLINQDSGG